MRRLFAMWCIAGLLASTQAAAVSVDQATFKKHGGKLSDVRGSIRDRHVLDELRAQSFSKPWQSVGFILVAKSWCSATWIGEEDAWSYILTAAHCIPYQGTATPMSVAFHGYDAAVVAEGAGTAYVPAARLDKPGFEASTDIAILKLPRRKTPVDDSGMPLEQPIFNDAPSELGKTVIFVGYGQWGAGSDVSAGYYPKIGSYRLYGRNLVDGIFEHERLLQASNDLYGPSAHWAAIRPGDSGSAWWQFQNGKPSMVAVSSAAANMSSGGTRISRYVKWIKAIYPGARMLSQERPKGCIVLAGALNISSRRTYCLHAGERSGYSLPAWIYGEKVDVQADSGVRVVLSDWDNLSYNRIASFSGTVENARLQRVKAASGDYLDFSRPRSMKVESIDGQALGCVISLLSAEKYCLAPGDSALRRLPEWMKGHDVFVQADPGVSIALYDERNRGYAFSGTVQNHELKRVLSARGGYMDLSRPTSIAIVEP